MTPLCVSRPPGIVIRLPVRGASPGFSRRDRWDLQLWGQTRRRRVEFQESDEGEFALLYEAEAIWARWGAMRVDGKVLVWDTVALADIGRFSTMVAALAALPVAASDVGITSVVVPFPLARR